MIAHFADTSYFIALLSKDDEAHDRALKFGLTSHRLVTTTWILVELADGLATRPDRILFKLFLDRLRSNPSVMIVEPVASDFDRAVELYDRRPDKQWSLTDCLSFVVMRDRQLSEALTGDHHFEQAGFSALLK
jgi:predicted nucleic acid-binding protein